jgi:hypothetical protein
LRTKANTWTALNWAPYIYCILSLTLSLGCSGVEHPLNGAWQVDQKATFAAYQSRQGAFAILPQHSPDWAHLNTTCFVIKNHAQLEVISNTGTQTFPIAATEIEPNLWKLSVDYVDYPFNIKVAVINGEMRILDAGHLFILEHTCKPKR